jgi:hypothetical protein
MKVEAIFGGILALFILGVAVFAIVSGSKRNDVVVNNGQYSTPTATPVAASTRNDLLCECFNEGFELAGSNVGVMSAQYRTGFEYCRAQLSDEGGCAWTAGWNARLSAKPFEASCRAYLRRGGC